ncbi:hypothetical protein RCL39_24955, partial [Salmonella enterica subsp. enterica serovar 1,4,[5],12:i:-]
SSQPLPRYHLENSSYKFIIFWGLTRSIFATEIYHNGSTVNRAALTFLNKVVPLTIPTSRIIGILSPLSLD